MLYCCLTMSIQARNIGPNQGRGELSYYYIPALMLMIISPLSSGWNGSSDAAKLDRISFSESWR